MASVPFYPLFLTRTDTEDMEDKVSIDTGLRFHWLHKHGHNTIAKSRRLAVQSDQSRLPASPPASPATAVSPRPRWRRLAGVAAWRRTIGGPAPPPLFTQDDVEPCFAIHWVEDGVEEDAALFTFGRRHHNPWAASRQLQEAKKARRGGVASGEGDSRSASVTTTTSAAGGTCQHSIEKQPAIGERTLAEVGVGNITATKERDSLSTRQPEKSHKESGAARLRDGPPVIHGRSSSKTLAFKYGFLHSGEPSRVPRPHKKTSRSTL